MNKIKELVNKRIDLLHLIIIEIVIGLSLIAIYKGLSIEQFLKLVDILVWPIVIFLALYFFRKVFTYLFFSLREFNFFGIKGELKNPYELIEEKTEERVKQNQEQEKRDKEIEHYETIVGNLNEEKDAAVDVAKDVLKEYIELNKEYRKFRESRKIGKILNKKIGKHIKGRYDLTR